MFESLACRASRSSVATPADSWERYGRDAYALVSGSVSHALLPQSQGDQKLRSRAWRFGKYYEDIIRKFLKLRYELMPFLYTTLEEAIAPDTVFRPLVLNYQNDPSTLNLDNEFMIGDDLLVAPILKPDVTQRLVYLPAASGTILGPIKIIRRNDDHG